MADPSSVTVADLMVVRPRQTRVEGQPVLAKRQALRYPQGLSPVIEFTIRDDEGRNVNLTGVGLTSADPSLASSSSASSAGEAGRLLLRLREVFDFRAESLPIEVEAVCWNAPAGVVRAKLPSSAGDAPGVMIAELGVYAPDGDLAITYDLHVLVERGQFGKVLTNRGLPAVDEVRMWMRDSDPKDNFLLKDFEFDLAEIIEAMIDCVREWNTSLPPIGRFYNTCTFPNPGVTRSGIMGRLYELAAKHYRRAHLAYSAGGVQVDDKNKAAEYEQIGQMMRQQYTQWVRSDRVRINRSNFNGAAGSPYGNRY